MSDQPEDNTKRRKAHPETIDISNGALFLEIEQLKRQVAYLERRLIAVEMSTGRIG